MTNNILVYAPEGPPPADSLIPTEILWRQGGYRWRVYQCGGTLWAVGHKPGDAPGRWLWFKCVPKEKWLGTQR